MRRISIRALMGAVVVLAVALAALRNANDDWAGGMLLGTALMIGVATIGAFYQAGAKRAARLGFASFAGGYFALVFLGLSEPKLASLPTHRSLTYVHNHVAPTIYISRILTSSGSSVGSGTTVIDPQNTGPTARVYPSMTLSQEASGGIKVGSKFRIGTPPSTTNSAWKAMLPGAANLEAFSTIGHCLYTLIAGLLGAAVALRCESKRDGRSSASPRDASAPQ